MIYLKYGKKYIEKLKEDDAKAILESIVDYCVSYAGDSYSDFARPVIKLLVSRKLVEYGEAKQIVRSDLQYIPLPIQDRDECCYHCQHSYEDETITGDWVLCCPYKKEVIFPSEVCRKFKEYEPMKG